MECLSSFQLTNVNLFKFCNNYIDTSTQKIIRIYYYDATFKQQWDQKRFKMQQSFHNRLKCLENVELKLGRLQGNYPDIKEKGVDTLLSVDMIQFTLNNSYDIGVILSADGDYVPAIQLCKDSGKNMWNLFYSCLSSFHLKNMCDRCITIKPDSIKKNKI